MWSVLVGSCGQQLQNGHLPASLRWVLKSDMATKDAGNIANNTADKYLLKMKVIAEQRKTPKYLNFSPPFKSFGGKLELLDPSLASNQACFEANLDSKEGLVTSDRILLIGTYSRRSHGLLKSRRLSSQASFSNPNPWSSRHWLWYFHWYRPSLRVSQFHRQVIYFYVMLIIEPMPGLAPLFCLVS